ncbi:MAG: type I-F CRISPR-associated endoribonuclease Cas6/Csy4 [Desulfarculus sp.]|nr:type I-F CRISPR-associated endoribonuclease Cas6/Csy4 [Pseudomonadota bacterium]MBU4597451.1 type I-F CRISPR-associated endoribonuclease Cas6/Csy4 [Pseudomonadota bacterium]MBV1718113.1 type I-F CRISPR-associated endoribonuclease Cas6/Csy4 [Desulfarculus sp.]MBV1740533.1 type I-F CRISPR-associated endoribonuclease Cas6/Csy4 [Desulfarculus sp.]
MDRYQDIRLLPDPEFAPQVLLNYLFGRLHRALAGIDNREIGISFPEVASDRPWLGQRLRLHGTAANLDKLQALGWAGHMCDHVSMGSMAEVPNGVRHRVVRRVQAKSSPERLRRRLMKRKGIAYGEARRLIPDSAAQTLALPFITSRSRSTGHNFHLFVEHGPLQDQPVEGEFNSYGLSAGATVPWF